MVAKAEYWRKLVPRVREQVGGLGVMGEGAGAHRGGAELSAGTARWPVGPFFLLGSGKVCFTRAQQVGVDSARGREPGTPGLREGRKVGARGAGAPLPGPALATPAGPQPRIRARFSQRPRPTLEVGFRGQPWRVDIAFYVEDYFQSSSPGKEVFAGVAFA